ncbi:MAG: helix-turn-helix domain-containing protein [Bacteroidota bacterium]
MKTFISSFFKNNKVLANQDKTGLLSKYQKSGLKMSEALEIKEKVRLAFECDKIHKSNTLGLNELSSHISIDRYKVSQVINEYISVNFYTLLNQYRVKDAKTLLIKNPDLSVKAIMYDVGFNSKTCFYGAFKKETGLSPNDFRNLVKFAS